MKVLHTIGGLSIKSGGTSACTYNLVSAMHKSKDSRISVDILTTNVVASNDSIIGKKENWIKTVDYDYFSPLSISLNLRKFLKESDYDIYHTNGLWMDVNHATALYARKKGKPYIITPHGMLYPEALRTSAVGKKIIYNLLYKDDLRHASIVHVTCAKELEHYRNLGFRNPVAIIPNPICIPSTEPSFHNSDNTFTIGYLGRIHPRKHIERLIYALDALKDKLPSLSLNIIGEGNSKHERFLRNEVLRLKLNDRVDFTGFVSGKSKEHLLNRLSTVVVPSGFENFGMIVPEALMMKVPVIASKGTPWQILEDEKCGWWVDNDVQTLADTIFKAFKLSPQERFEMGERGRQLVIDNFLDTTVASKMAELYRWVGGEGPKPDFVDTLY